VPRLRPAPLQAADPSPRAYGWLALDGLAGTLQATTFTPWPAPAPPWAPSLLQILTLTWLAARTLSASTPARAGVRGFAFGLGTFGVGIGWIFISLHVYAELSVLVASLATFALAAGLSSAPALASALTAAWAPCALGRSANSSAASRARFGDAACFAASWTAFELLRGYAFTGFPWLAVGYAHVDSPLAGWAPALGVYGVSAAAALIAGCLAAALAAAQTPRRQKVGLLATTLLILITGALLRQHAWVRPQGEPLTVRLLQGNVTQDLKFDPQRALNAIERYGEWTAAGSATLTVMPETAWVVSWLDGPWEERERLLTVARERKSWIALGIPMPTADPWRVAILSLEDGITNSVALIGPRSAASSQFLGRYDKRHLVPFGEFIPLGFRWFVDLMVMPMGDFSRGTPDPDPLPVADQRIAFNVCYEDLFGEELLGRIEKGASIFVNVSNIAWFSGSHALPQHLQIARMRTLELGRPMLRATNTGVTAAIDHRAHVIAQLPILTEGALDAVVQGTEGTTLYTRIGNLGVFFGCLSILAACAIHRRQTRSWRRLPASPPL